jgi:hypothetical protein
VTHRRVSRDLEGFELDDIGPQHLRGRAAPVRIYAVTATRSPDGGKTM